LYREVYCVLSPVVKPVFRAIAKLRGGGVGGIRTGNDQGAR